VVIIRRNISGSLHAGPRVATSFVRERLANELVDKWFAADDEADRVIVNSNFNKAQD
jgi:hypothetical protein